MAESRERADTGFQNEPLMPDAPNRQPEGEVMGQAPMLAADNEAPELDISKYPDVTGDVVETAYPEQDSAIDATQEQSRVGADEPEPQAGEHTVFGEPETRG